MGKLNQQRSVDRLIPPAEDLFPVLSRLPRTEKLKVMQFLIAELAKKEEPTLQAGATYPVWSPINTHTAAHTLGQMLESDRTTHTA